MIKCVVNSGLVVLKLIIHMNSTKCTKQSSPYSKSSTSVYLTLYTVCRSLLEKKKKKNGIHPKQPWKSFYSSWVFSSGCHDNCAFYFWLLWNGVWDQRSQMLCKTMCALFQTGVSCCRELKVINYRGMADTQGASPSTPCLPYSFHPILKRCRLRLLCRKLSTMADAFKNADCFITFCGKSLYKMSSCILIGKRGAANHYQDCVSEKKTNWKLEHQVRI